MMVDRRSPDSPITSMESRGQPQPELALLIRLLSLFLRLFWEIFFLVFNDYSHSLIWMFSASYCCI